MNDAIRFRISFSQSWILTKRGSSMLPPDEILHKLENMFNVSNTASKIYECTGTIKDKTYDDDTVIKMISDLINQTYDISDKDEIYTIELQEEESTAVTDDAEEAVPAPVKTQKKKATLPKGIPSFDELVGAEEFKALAQKCIKLAPRLIENEVADAFTARAYVISINEGYGLTTYLNAFAELLDSLTLFEFSSSARVAEVRLSPPDEKNAESPFGAALAHFQGRSKGKVVCIDISEWMSKLTDKPFREFLKHIDEHVGENIVFFRIPFVEKSVITKIQRELGDVLTVSDISIPPFTNSELRQCATALLSKRGYSIDKDAWPVFDARIAAEKSDGRFYGVNTIKKIIREMLYEKQLMGLDRSTVDKVIHRGDIVALVDSDSIKDKSGFEQLSELVGMESIQERVREVIAQIEAAVTNDALETPCIHMRFVGNPGTGKTTVARIIGTILKEKGILRNGSFFEHSGRDLCGRFVGETAPKTSAICRDAYGSVLFIDEAYSLYRDDGISNADYGREAIDTLVAEMENHRSDLMVIMAGYPNEMEKLMSGNVGLKSRMPYLIEFSNYTREQLAAIFLTMASKGFHYNDDFTNAVKTYFESLSDEIMCAKDFSNARFVRNLFERTWGKGALRCQMNQTECTELTVEDFALATADKEFNSILEQKKRKIGFN